jgi:hypothetical protein
MQQGRMGRGLTKRERVGREELVAGSPLNVVSECGVCD